MKYFLTAILLYLSVSCSVLPEVEQRPFELLLPTRLINQLELGAVEGESVIVSGAVTTSDSCRNFYQELFVEDGTGVLRVGFSFYNTYSMFPQNEMVSVILDGLTIAEVNGVLSVEVGSPQIAAKSIVRQGIKEAIAPRLTQVDEVDSTMLGRYVRIDDCQFRKGGIANWAGEQTIDTEHGALKVYTNSYAAFADRSLPSSSVNLTGIVTIYNGKFQLKLSSDSDCDVVW